MVALRHPDLPGRQIDVPEIGVAHRERAGWRRVDEVPPEPVPVPEDDPRPELATAEHDEGEPS